MLRVVPSGGLGWIWIRMSLYEEFQLPKLRLHAVGRVWWDLDVPSCGRVSPLPQKLRFDALGRV